MPTHSLAGLRVAPYASYLAAQGLRDLIVEQADPACEHWWSAGCIHVHTRMGRDELLDFFCDRYAPTPIASPWNAGSGFYPGESGEALEAISESRHPRFGPYRETLSFIVETLSALKLRERPAGEGKVQLLRALASSPDPAGRRWMDAVVRFQDSGLAYSPLFFTGGNDAKLEMSRVFQFGIVALFLREGQREKTRSSLEALLFDQAASTLYSQTHGALDPFTTASPNGSSEGESSPLGAPWSYVLALEGLLRLGDVLRRHVPRGQASLLPEESRRPDLWLPLRRPDLLVGNHIRYAVLPRNGKAHFCIPIGLATEPPQPLILPEPHQRRRILHLEDLGRVHCPSPRLGALELPPYVDSPERRLACSLATFDLELGGDLERALIRAQRTRCRAVGRRFARASSARPARPGDILAFLEGRVDLARLRHLVKALRHTSHLPPSSRKSPGAALLPLSYRILKRALAPEHGDPIRILELLERDDLPGAWRLALERLGHPSVLVAETNVSARRLGAALAFPLKAQDHVALHQQGTTGG